MFKKGVALLLIGSCLSCNFRSEETEKEIESYKTEITSLKKKIQIKESVNFSLREINEKNESKIEALEEKAKSQFYLSKNEASYLIDEKMQFILNKKDFLDKTIKIADFKNNSFFEIYNFFFYFGDYYESNPVEDERGFMQYLMNRFDRNSDNIRSFFNEDIIEYLAEAIRLTGAYESSGLESRINFLLTAYEDEASDPDLFLKLHKKFSSNEWSWNEDFLLNLPSENVKMIMSDSFEVDVDAQKVFDSYGFWARRHKEGNAEVVYTILKEFKTFLP